MRWWFSFGWLCRAWEKRRQRQPSRRWVKYIQPRLEPLEDRRLFANNVWLPQQLAAFDGTSQTNLAMQLFQPATTTLLPQLGLQGTSVSAAGSVSLTDKGNYQLSLTQSGPYDDNGDRYTFTVSGPVTFSLTELGAFSATGFSINSVTLSQTAALSWSLVETNSSGQTVQNLGGLDTVTPTSNGGAPFDPFFPQGFNWLPLAQQISSVNSLGLSDLAADSLSVTETDGSDAYAFQETNGVATVQGNVQQPLSNSLLQSGQNSYSETAVEQFDSTVTGSDCFSLTELGQFANGSYALSNVSYQETSGTQTSQFNATVTDSQSGTATESGSQSFSGNNQSSGNSSGETFQFNNVNTLSYGETASSNFTLTQQGSYGGGSFSLSSLSYNANGSGGYSLTQTSLQTQTGSFSDSSTDSGTDSYGIGGTATDNGTSTDSGNFTTTQSGTLHDNESGNFTLSEAGAYGNASWSLSSYNLSEALSGSYSQQQLGTTTQNGNGTTTDSGGGSDSFALGFGATNTTDGGDSVTSTDTSTDSFTLTSTTYGGASSYTLSELGSLQGGVPALTSYVFTSGQSGTYTASGSSNETDTGNAQDTSSGSDSASDSASDGSVSDDLGGDDTFSGSDSYSFTSNDSSSSSDGGGFNQSVYQAGLFSNGSYNLSSVVNTSGQNDNWSQTSTDSSTDSGSDSDSDDETDQSNDTVQFGGDSLTGQETDTFYETDSDTFVDTSFDTVAATGSTQFSLTQVGSYSGDSFSFNTVTYNANGTANDTTQDSDDETYTDTSSDCATDDSNQTSIACLANSTDSGSGSDDFSDTDSFSGNGIDTFTETLTAADSSTAVEVGSFLGGVWNLSHVSVSESSSDSYSSQDLDSSTDSGTDSLTATDSNSSGDTSVYGGGSMTGSGNGNVTLNGSDTFTDHDNDTLTNGGSDSFSLSEQGSFANYSFAFTSLVYQGGDSVTDTMVDASSETSVGVETDDFSDDGSDSGLGSYAFGNDSNSYSATDSGADSFSTSGSDSTTDTTASSETDSFYDAGQFVNGSLTLSVVSYLSGGTDSWLDRSGDTSMDSGTVDAGDTLNAGECLSLTGNPDSTGSAGDRVSGGDSQDGNDSDTSYDSSTDSGSDCWSLTELGSFSNGSYSYSSYVSQDGGSDNDTVIESATDSFSGTVTDSSSGSDSQSDGDVAGYDDVNAQNGDDSGDSDDFHETDLGQSDETVTSSDTWSDYAAGILSGNSWALSSVSDTSGGSDTWTEAGSDTSTDSGQETISGGLSFSGNDTVNDGVGLSATNSGAVASADTLSGTDTRTSSESANGSGSDSWSQVEQGSYGNYSYAFTNVVVQSGGSSGDCLSDNSTDTFSGSLTTTGSASGQQSGSDDVGLSDGDDDGQSSNSGSETETESINSRDTLTGGDSAVWSEYESGGYSGGSYAFSSLNYQDSGSDNTTDTSLGTSYGTFAGSGSESQTLSGAVGGTFADDFSASSAGSATGSSSGTDTGSSDMTAQSGDCWSLTELGSYSNGSYSLSSYVSSSSDSNSVDAQDTDSVTETVTATGSQSDDSAETNAATVQGTWTSGGSPPSSGTFVVTVDDGQGGDESGSFTETTTVTETNTVTELETFSESDYQAGVYSAGSFNLSCVVYSLSSSGSSSDSVTDSSNGTNVSLDTSQDNASSGGDQDGFSDNDGYAVASNDTANGHETMSGSDTATAQSQFTESLYQAGNFSNDSYSLSSYAFSEQGGDTVTSSSSDTYTTLDTGTDSGHETILDVSMYVGSDAFTETITGGDSSAATQNDSWSLTELGTMSAGVMALSCYALSEQESSSGSSNDSSSWSETFTGTDGRFGFSGGDSGSGSDNQSSSASGTLLEVGTATGDVLTLSLVSYSGSGSESGSASDGDGGSWSGQSYSGKDSDSAQSGDSGSYSVSALGSYSNGSWSLSSYVLDGSSTDWATQSASEQDTFSYGTGCLGSGNQYYSRSDTTGSQESDSVYQTGVETAGVYANGSYNGVDDSVASATQDTSSPYLSSIDTWQTSETQTELLTGGSATSSSSFGFRDTNYSGSGVGSVQESLTLTPPGVLVDLLLPDASSVPVVGADESSGGMPVSTPDVGVVAATAEWLSGTGAAAQEVTQPDSAMPMVPPGAVGGPTQTPAAAVKQVVNGAGLTPAGSGPAIQNLSYQPKEDKPVELLPGAPHDLAELNQKNQSDRDNLRFRHNGFMEEKEKTLTGKNKEIWKGAVKDFQERRKQGLTDLEHSWIEWADSNAARNEYVRYVAWVKKTNAFFKRRGINYQLSIPTYQEYVNNVFAQRLEAFQRAQDKAWVNMLDWAVRAKLFEGHKDGLEKEFEIMRLKNDVERPNEMKDWKSVLELEIKLILRF